MRSIKSIILFTGLIALLTVTGCTKTTVDNEEAKVYKPNITRYEISNTSLLDEVDKVLNYIYLGGEKPTGEYMKNIDKMIDGIDNQRYYLDEFFERLTEMQNELDDLGINMEELEEEYTGNEDAYVDGDVNWSTEEYNKPINNSTFILTDSDGRDYIDINQLEFFNDGIYFNYDGVEYMLDIKEFKPNMRTIRLKQHNYKLALAKEDDVGKIVAVYIDTKTGDGKTITILHDGNNITFIDMEI